jgi:hypothetical protein
VNGLVFYIGLGLGLAVAAGLRPFLPALLAGALGSNAALGVNFAHSGYEFLQSGWWLLAVAVALTAAWALQLYIGATRFEAGPLGAAVAGIGIGVGALLFGGTLAEHGDAAWPGLLGGAAAAVLVQAASRPLLARTRARLTGSPPAPGSPPALGSPPAPDLIGRGPARTEDRGAREALTLYVDAVSLALAGLVALLHPLGYVAVALFAWLAAAGRRRGEEKYAGLRILRR